MRRRSGAKPPQVTGDTFAFLLDTGQQGSGVLDPPLLPRQLHLQEQRGERARPDGPCGRLECMCRGLHFFGPARGRFGQGSASREKPALGFLILRIKRGNSKNRNKSGTFHIGEI